MASTRRKAAAAGLAVIGIAGLSLAAAAQLTVNTSQLAAGSAIVTGCDTAVTVDYAVTGQNVTGVILGDVAGACANADYSVTLTGTSGTLTTLAGTSLTLTGTGDARTANLPITDTVTVASVTGVAVVLN